MGDSDESLRVVALLGCAAVLAAAVGAYSAVLGDRGSDHWHEAIREDIRQGARIASDARRLYEEDAIVAHRVAGLQLRAEALRRESDLAGGDASAIIAAEAEAQGEAAQLLSAKSRIAPGDPVAATELTGDDVLGRFAEIRGKLPEDVAGLDPDAVEAQGADEQDEAELLLLAGLASGVALLLGALAEALPGWRRRLTNAGFAIVALGVLGALAVVV